jgi:hypothetical protein
MSITHDPKTNTLNISIQLPAQPSISKSSGKMNNCGGTGGFVVTTATVQGKPVKVSVNAII